MGGCWTLETVIYRWFRLFQKTCEVLSVEIDDKTGKAIRQERIYINGDYAFKG